MSLLEKRVHVEQESIAVRIRRETSDRVKQYARFVNRDKGEVIDGLLEFALGKDKDFADWLKTDAAQLPASAAKGNAR